MVSSLRAFGGTHTLEDFAATACDYVAPISGGYRGHELVELPPNGQGVTAILMAAILERFDLAALDPFGAERAHLEAEAARLAYDARDRFVADPDVPGVRLEHLLAPGTADRLAALIDPARAMPAPARAAEAVHRETIYLTVVDRDRMAVSLIYSVYHSFGAGLASARFGINFQNRGAGFSLAEGHPNEAAGGKRPLHTIIPAMLRRDGRLLMPFGVMGGAYQPAGHVRLISNLLDFGLDPQRAIDAPRSFPDGGELRLETGYPEAVAAALTALGHRVTWCETPLGGAQAIVIDSETDVLTRRVRSAQGRLRAGILGASGDALRPHSGHPRPTARTSRRPPDGQPARPSRHAPGSAPKHRRRNTSSRSRRAGGRTAGPCAGGSPRGSTPTIPRCC